MRSRFLRTIVVLVPGLTGVCLIVLETKLYYRFADAEAQLGNLAAVSLRQMLGSLGLFGVGLAVFILVRRSKDRGKLWRFGNAVGLITLTVLLLGAAIGLAGLYWAAMRCSGDAPAETRENTSAASAEWIRQDADVIGGDVGMLVDDDGDAITPGVAAFAVYDAFGNEMASSAPTAGVRTGCNDLVHQDAPYKKMRMCCSELAPQWFITGVHARRRCAWPWHPARIRGFELDSQSRHLVYTAHTCLHGA